MKTSKFLLIALVLVILDQLTKFILYGKEYMLYGIGISPASNTGAAFGIFQGNNIILALISLSVIVAVIYYHRKIKGIPHFALVLVLAGASGNLIDRLLFGFVRDFIAIYWWPNFNMADSYNVIGILILIVNEFRHKK